MPTVGKTAFSAARTMNTKRGFVVRINEALRHEAREQFNSNGYYHARSVFSATEIARLEDDFDLIVEQIAGSCENINARWDGEEAGRLAEESDAVFHTHNVQRYSRNWLDAILNDSFLEFARTFLGENIILHHSKLFQKPAGHGAPFPMHQDWPYFPTSQDKMIAGVIHVSKATDQMGCLRFWPASHKLGRLEAAHGRQGSRALLDYPLEEASAIEAEPGDTVFFHYLTLHGSKPNRSLDPRKTVLVQMYAGEEEVEEGHFGMHINEQLVLRGRNIHISRARAGVPRETRGIHR